ncbi:MAG: gamma-glutamyl-gamma-aminobutyrate hydrolase family protein [Pseudomonadota bacterium]
MLFSLKCGGWRRLWFSKLAVVSLFLILTGVIYPGSLGAQEIIKESPQRPWIMIGLSPSGCSGGCRRVRSVISEISGNKNVVTLDFRTATIETIADLNPEFIVLSPQGTPWCRYTGSTGVSLQNFLWMIPQISEQLDIPILGICGGHQAIALAFGGKVGPIRAGEDDCMPYSRDRQSGVTRLSQYTKDPIFAGLDAKISIIESHYDEVKALPPGFLLLASEKISANQIIRHPFKPVYGIQGHPESFVGFRPDGVMLIRNFVHIAKTYNETVRTKENHGGLQLSLKK